MSDIITVLGLFVILFALHCTFLVYRVEGHSMEPTLAENSLGIAIKNTSHIYRQDIVIINTGDKKIIKRVVGLPNETLECRDGKLYVGTKEIVLTHSIGDIKNFSIQLNNNEYFCLGDNLDHSKDSRSYGPFTVDQIIAVVLK